MKTKNSSSVFCVPRVKTSSRISRDEEITPMTLLDRFRDAVLRLIMISAVSNSKSSTTSSQRRNKQPQAKVVSQKYYNTNDPFQSEAVADCIEFIRTKKAINDT